MRAYVWPVVLASALFASLAWAAPNDIVLTNLVQRDANGQPMKNPNTDLVMGDQDAFKGLTTELGLVFSPRSLAPSETPGHAGFDIGLDYTLHFIQPSNSYWADSTERGQAGRTMPPVLQTLGVRARKGLPFSLEVGGGGQYLFESHMYAVGADIRWALNEGFIWLPDLAVTLSVNRLLGNDQIDLTVASAGAQISKTFGLFGMMRLAPFAGYNYVAINAASAVIDPDPRSADDIGGNFTFDQVSILGNGYHRAVAGLRLGSFIFDLTIEGDINFAGQQSVQQLGFQLSLNF
ncbi:MAG: hypothetical protein ABIJ09_00755 [Pseudomonadota bacterium]